MLDEFKVRSLFDPLIVAEILKIKLSPIPRLDMWLWDGDKQGCLSVKSAYHTIQNIKLGLQGDCSYLSSLKQVYKNIWQLKVFQKIKIFVWRACRDAFPTLHNLEKKQVRVENKCMFSHLPNEDILHALFSCRDIWLL